MLLHEVVYLGVQLDVLGVGYVDGVRREDVDHVDHRVLGAQPLLDVKHVLYEFVFET